MAEEKKPAAKKPAAKKPAAKPAAKKAAPAKSAAAKPAAKKTTAAAKPAAKKPAAKPAAKKTTSAAAKPAAAKTAKPAAKKTTTAAKPAAKSTAAKPAAKSTGAAKPAAKKAPAKPAASKTSPEKTPSGSTPAKPAAKKAPAKKSTDVARPGVLKLHHLRPAPGAKKARTRVGRGEGSKGKTAGRGTKGTKARYQVRPGFEGGQLTSVMRAPKLRGFTNPFRVEYQVVNVGRLSELYPKGGDVTVADLVAKGAVRKNEKVKVLADGDLSVKLTVTVDKVSAQAKEKIEKAGGEVR